MNKFFFISSHKFLFIVIVVSYIFTLRGSTLKIPLLNRTATSIADEIWCRVCPKQCSIYKNFGERYGTPMEGFDKKLRDTFSELVSGLWGAKLTIRNLGEPTEVPSMLRKRPEIVSISLSQVISDKEHVELYQRIHEGIYPIKVVTSNDSTYRLITPSEVDKVSPCKVLDKSREVVLVSCP